MEIDIFVNILEVTGTVAFASSGALTAVQCGMDLLGVNVLALVTAAGGGVIRDIIIGRLPPAMFSSPLCILVSLFTANLIFIILKAACKKNKLSRFTDIYDRIMPVLDTVGLSVFTVTGINAGIDLGYSTNYFLLVFSGTVTGVGGGVIRDIMADRKPYIFVSQIYACAAVVGAVVFLPVYHLCGFIAAGAACFLTVAVIRSLAIFFRWNLPHISSKNFRNSKGE
ncbi:MAG: trimeric intracellular cation channel family protein [Huintestinicola sp.]|uniref:trimeric intracellular cation channel family protein n=1 Tax=Huintestinicola sp. TaxID=2981661 RepID=UPI003F0D6E57